MELKNLATVAWSLVLGGLFGGSIAAVNYRTAAVEKSCAEHTETMKKQVDELKAAHQSLLGELNQKILPALQAELAKAKK